MVVFILQNVAPSLRGELSRWLFEVKAGVFTGRVSALVRDELWEMVTKKIKDGSAVMVYTTNSEQGFAARILGDPTRTLVDIEGVLIVKTA
ncbi:MAG: type I-E CRISPR-associated endoribonuclease Cas2e [Cyanobacteriota bacterium]|nr:type I-E CRISPR-associated endoribonuclease Cas2e [Cyanobacteriota bacterium]